MRQSALATPQQVHLDVRAGDCSRRSPAAAYRTLEQARTAHSIYQGRTHFFLKSTVCSHCSVPFPSPGLPLPGSWGHSEHAGPTTSPGRKKDEGNQNTRGHSFSVCLVSGPGLISTSPPAVRGLGRGRAVRVRRETCPGQRLHP